MQAERLRTLLSKIYGAETGATLLPNLVSVIDKYKGRIPSPSRPGLSERDALLITYADQVKEDGRPGLASLADFCSSHIGDLVSGIHVLPFYPWSSDDGFAVVDYQEVAPEYGEWEDLRKLGENYRLMFDAVINHSSAESTWFKGYLDDAPAFADHYIQVNGDPDLSEVVRPRALPLLTEFKARSGPRKVWTTFSGDQVDLNYHNPTVLLRMLDILLYYARQGAELVRLDAIAYLWKQLGTRCINLPETHLVVQLMRAVLDEGAPHVLLITETNVPNLENLSYFGDGTNEAQLVYNFPLPPLVLHALQTGNARTLSKWAATLELPSERVTFLNFLASHDGIGLNPVRGILPEKQIEELAGRVERGGGYISYKANADGSQSPYELNANYFDALNCGEPAIPAALQQERFLTAHAILLAFRGLPAIYFHSLFGSRGWPEGVRETQKHRAINREKLRRSELEEELAAPDSRRSNIFTGMRRLLEIRREHPCFAPQNLQRILHTADSIFAFLREETGTGKAVLCIHNVSDKKQAAQLNLTGTILAGEASLHDLIGGEELSCRIPLSITLQPYQSAWLSN